MLPRKPDVLDLFDNIGQRARLKCRWSITSHRLCSLVLYLDIPGHHCHG